MEFEEILNIKEEDVLSYIEINNLSCKSRKRTILDPRDFLINILYYNFNWSEVKIGDLFNKHHSTINHCKNNAYYLRKNRIFLKNTHEVRNTFPSWLPPSPDSKVKPFKKRVITVSMQLNEFEYKKLHKLRNKLKVRNLNTAAKHFIFSNIDEIL